MNFHRASLGGIVSEIRTAMAIALLRMPVLCKGIHA